MARVYVRAPRGSIITYEGRDYNSSTRLPDDATSYQLTMWVDFEPEDTGEEETYRTFIYLPDVPTSATREEVQAMIDQEYIEMILTQSYKYPEGE